MKYIKSLFLALVLVTTFSRCDMSDFGDINTSPNSPSTAYTNMLFCYASKYVRYFIMNSSSYDPWTQEWTGYISEAKNNQFGPLTTTTQMGTSSFYSYYIKNLNTIIELNEDESSKDETYVTAFGENTNQIAAAKTLRAFYYMSMTDVLGPLPYTEAYKGESEGNWTPAFDSQETIYTGLFEDLEDAYDEFDDSGSLDATYDILYGGDISKWKKFNATLRMMMAIKLADVDPSTGKTRFATAYSDGGMEDVDDGFNYTYDTSTAYSSFYYIGNKSYSSANLTYVPNKIIVDYLKEYQDPRLFVYCTLDGYYAPGGDASDFDAYYGIPFGLASNSDVNDWSKVCCAVADSYCEATATFGIITTARCKLVEAEAALLGWISADAETLYEDGIRASFEFSGADDVESYLTKSKVVLSSDTDTALEQVVTQRFLAGYLTDGVEAWSDWRRYAIPDMPMYDGQLANGYTTYPYRMCYSDTDVDYNQTNYEDAVNAYLNGNDDRWERVWWDTEDNAQVETPELTIPVSWSEYGVGNYEYYYFWSGTDEGLTLYSCDNDETSYKITNWGGGVSFTFSWDTSTNEITVDDQSIGYTHSTYGDVYVMDLVDYTGSEDYGVSYYEDGVFYFAVIYYVSAGYFGYGTETFTLTSTSSGLRKLDSTSTVISLDQLKSKATLVPSAK